jgi:divalent metal cation (Fe/Co/Zn/Cd) transporter
VADLLVGRSLPPDRLEQLARILASDPAIEQVLSLHAVYTGPQEVIVAAKVHPAAGLTIDELTRAMDSLDTAVRSALPEVADVYLDVTSDRLDTRPGAQPVGTTE